VSVQHFSFSVFLFTGLIAVSCLGAAEKKSADAIVDVPKEISSANAVARAADQIVSVWDRHRFMMIGELHGTNETPELIAAMLKSRVSKERVLLGLEIPRDEQERIDTYLQSGGSSTSRQAMLQGAHWRGQDGRSSLAMIGLLEQLRRLRNSGYKVDVVCFDGSADDFKQASTNRDAVMATNLRAAMKRRPADRTLTLTGNIHNQLVQRPPGSPLDNSMAWNLRDLGPETINISALRGSAWNCRPECKAHNFDSHNDSAPEWMIQGSPDENGWYGIYRLPQLSAAPPALSAKS